jgi:uncharacterized cupin superfamily protein
MHEAGIEQTAAGLVPAGEGWFLLNLAQLAWATVPGGGTWCSFEAPSARSPVLGIGVHVLRPGEAPGMYHAEDEEEGFLVLSGECLAIVEGQERRMGPWDYLRCPPGTGHITIGAGQEPCAILMVGTRCAGRSTHYPVEPAAARYGASVAEATDAAQEAYAGRPPITPAPSPWPLQELRPHGSEA